MQISEATLMRRLNEASNRLPLNTVFKSALIDAEYEVKGYSICKENNFVDILLRASFADGRLFSTGLTDFADGVEEWPDHNLARCKVLEDDYVHELAEAEHRWPVGSAVRHYEDGTRTYKITAHSIEIFSREVIVHYSANYGIKLPFSRTLVNFCGQVSLNGVEVPRFEQVTT